MLDQRLIELVQRIKFLAKEKYIATAESCSGGLVASYLTSIPGSSDYFTTGIVSYSNKAKMKLLDVSKKTIDKFGAVSEEVAREMAIGLMKISDSDISISVTGVAGPGGGTTAKPVGMVCFGVAIANDRKTITHYFSGTRSEIRQQSCEISLNLILDELKN